MDEKIINRINELARKSKETELSEDEKKEQESLRKEYVKAFRGNLENQLKNIKIVD